MGRYSKNINVVDLFCGAGGLSLGFEMAGFNVILGVDSDPECIRTYNSNFREGGVVRDVTRIRDIGRFVDGHTGGGDVHVLTGGPPCQTYSPAGRVKLRSLGRDPEKDPRNGLWKWFMKFAEELRPLYFVVENVPGMASVRNSGEALPDHIIGAARDLGYSAEWKILDAKDYGVPQTRRRLFIIGNRTSTPIPWPEKRTRRAVTVWEAISDLPVIPHGFREHEIEYTPRGRLTPYQRGMRRNAGSVLHNHVTRWHREEDLIAFELLPEGGRYTDLPEKLRRYRDDIFRDRYRKLRRDEPSWTIDAHMSRDTYRYIYPSRPGDPEPPRTISVREAARLQSFPDTFLFPEKLTHAFRQIGNSVPPLMARAVAEAIMHDLRRFVGISIR